MQAAYLIITLQLLFYKAYLFDYPPLYFVLEVGALLLLTVWQLIRLFVGTKGNKLETSSTTLGFICMGLVALLGNVYFLQFQTYVLAMETYLNYLCICLGAIELLLSGFAAIEFKSLENTQ